MEKVRQTEEHYDDEDYESETEDQTEEHGRGGDDSEEEEGEETMMVEEGEIYNVPGVCQTSLREMILARSTSLLAEKVYGIPRKLKK